MKWTPEAETAIKKVPFFVRKKVRARVEKEAYELDREIVSIADVKATQKRYLSNMSTDIKGYQLDICFGPNGCPNRANAGDTLLSSLEDLLQKEDLLGFLKQRVEGDLKFHHEFRISLADCPNACSQPQIKDIGIIGACSPSQTDETCTQCEACVEACKEDAVILNDEGPEIDYARCINCAKCIQACPTGTLAEGKKGFRVQLGGKLGRHPQLARELPGIYDENQVMQIVKDSIDFYKQNSRQGERFAEIFKDKEFEAFVRRYAVS
ncbi:MAG: 4Fe-4S dicluster domain-containing protein [Desulfobacterales bacterium]